MFGQCRRRKTCKEIITSVKVVCLLSEINFQVSQLNQFSVLTQKRMDPSSVTVLSTFTENFCSNTRDLSKMKIAYGKYPGMFCMFTWLLALLYGQFFAQIHEVLHTYQAGFATIFALCENTERPLQKCLFTLQMYLCIARLSGFSRSKRAHRKFWCTGWKRCLRKAPELN